MAGINFNGNNYNNNLNGLNAKTNFNNILKSGSGQKNDDLRFKNQLDQDSFEFSGSKSTEGNNQFNVKSKSSASGSYWDRVNYYLGKGESKWMKSAGNMLDNDPLANNMAGNGHGAGAFALTRFIVAMFKAI